MFNIPERLHAAGGEALQMAPSNPPVSHVWRWMPVRWPSCPRTQSQLVAGIGGKARAPLLLPSTFSLNWLCLSGALLPPVFPNVFISLYRKDSIKFRILTFRRPHGPDMGYYPLSICDSKHSCDFCACHQLICCVWFIQPWLERVICRHTFGNSLTSF